jgi:hypothetical protein
MRQSEHLEHWFWEMLYVYMNSLKQLYTVRLSYNYLHGHTGIGYPFNFKMFMK